MVDIHVIGAGGGSFAMVDDAGALKVGPMSAGADPGPAAYGLGGTQATITDAQIVLHRLNPEGLLGGRLKVDVDKARRAVLERVAGPLGLAIEQAAEGIIRIANANMSRAIRAVSTERGYNLADFALLAYGGAGPLHAIDVASECGIPKVIVPQEPGTLCARGMLLTDVSFDFVRSVITVATDSNWQGVLTIVTTLRNEADAWLQKERVAPEARAYRIFIDARYEGQNFEVIVAIPGVGEPRLDAFLALFAGAHEREYGYALADRPVEIVNVRLQAIGRVPKAPLNDYQCTGSIASAEVGRREVYFSEAKAWITTPVLDRAGLPAGTVIVGPAVIEEMSSTLAIAPGRQAVVDRMGNLIVDVGRKAN
jgi:N-methylhydantoinase A